MLEFASVARALVAGRLGNVSACASTIDAMAKTDECRALSALIRAAHVERMQGDWNTERSALDSAIETLRAGHSRFLVWALAEAVTGAWFAGDEPARQCYADALHEAVLQYDAGGFVYFGAMPSSQAKPTGLESPRWLAVAHLMAACAAATWGEAREWAARAVVEATKRKSPFCDY